MSTDLRHRLGATGERLAREHLARLGYRILDANHRTRWGELDIVAASEGWLVFCEVKTRRAGGASPFAALDEAKARQVRRMAAAWLSQRAGRPYAPDIRFDAIGVTIDAHDRLVALEHLEGAF